MATVADLVSTYPYLLGSLIALAIFSVGYAVCPRGQKGPMLISAGLSAPYALASVLVVPAYWEPVRIATFLAGPEDLIFSFANGGILWVLVVRWAQNHVSVNLRWKRILRRYIACTVYAFGVGLALRACGVYVVTSLTVGFLFVAATVLYRRLAWLPTFIRSALSFLILYLLVTVLTLTVCPDFIKQWTAQTPWTQPIWGVPLGEIVFPVVFGIVWPSMMVYAFDAKRVANLQGQG